MKSHMRKTAATDITSMSAKLGKSLLFSHWAFMSFNIVFLFSTLYLVDDAVSKDSKHTVFDTRTNAFIKVTSSKDEIGYREKLIVPTIQSYIAAREGAGQPDQLDKYRCVAWMSEGEHAEYFKNLIENEFKKNQKENITKNIKIIRTWLLSSEENVWQTDFDIQVLNGFNKYEDQNFKFSARITYEWRDQLLSPDNIEDNDYFICNPGGMMITGYKVAKRKE